MMPQFRSPLAETVLMSTTTSLHLAMAHTASASAEPSTELPPVPRRVPVTTATVPVTGRPIRSRSQSVISAGEENEKNMAEGAGNRLSRPRSAREKEDNSLPKKRTERDKAEQIKYGEDEEGEDDDDDDDDDDVDDDDDDDDAEVGEESESGAEKGEKFKEDNVEIVKNRNGAQERLLRALEKADDLSDAFSDDSEIEASSRPERLTRRQRAMQGEDIQLEYTKLESPKLKKMPVEEEWSNDEEAGLKKQQRARLRQMIHEKRNKEKRAAMVDKLLRGVTSKRKKMTLASEERVALVGNRLRDNEMRDGCIRFISNRKGISLSIPAKTEAPTYLQSSEKAVYPPKCKRDPKTGKRIFQ